MNEEAEGGIGGPDEKKNKKKNSQVPCYYNSLSDTDNAAGLLAVWLMTG